MEVAGHADRSIFKIVAQGSQPRMLSFLKLT